MRLKSLFAALAALTVATLLLPNEAQAQSTRRCLITAQSTPAAVTYDPFNPTPVNVTNVQINFARVNGPGGEKPSVVDFYLKSTNSGVNGTELIPVSVVGTGTAAGLGQDIFYGTNETPPNITVPLGNTPIPGVMRYSFTGNNAASDVFSVNFTIKLAQNINLTAAANTSIQFDIEYGCNGTGGGPPFSERASAPNAFTLNVKVLSGLQASFIGTALDFGEVGDKTDAQAGTITQPSGNVRVASSGPYTVSMVSTNNYRMTYPGGDKTVEAQNLRYQVSFLGSTRNTGNLTPIAKTCVRAGLGSPPLSGGVNLPVSVQLLEGGAEETPSSNYSDTLEVTVTPLVATAVGSTCP